MRQTTRKTHYGEIYQKKVAIALNSGLFVNTVNKTKTKLMI